MAVKSGDNVEITTKDEVLEGILMPSKKGKMIVKLKSGYNLSLDKKEVKKVKKVIEKKKKSIIKKKKVISKKGLKEIVILHCGGTFASKVDYTTGAVSAKFGPEELLEMFPEVGEIANIRSRLIRNMFSEDMNFRHYNLIANEIYKEVKKGVDGIIITHGTDTLHYTSAALAFILENLDVPIILVGAQRSSDRGSSDAFLNLYCAVKFIVESDFSEVAICMHESLNDINCSILPACKTRKLNSSRRDAFKAINVSAFARVNKKDVKYLRTDFKRRDNKRELELKLFKDVNVGILRVHPGMKVEEIKCFSRYDGLVIEGTGLGHMPVSKTDEFTSENSKIFIEMKKLAKKISVVMTTQCIFGRVNMNVYSNGILLKEIGVLGNLLDLTTEAAFIKMSWLLSNYPKEVRYKIGVDFRGEIGKRTSEKFI